jgi:hypothetical protein
LITVSHGKLLLGIAAGSARNLRQSRAQQATIIRQIIKFHQY